MDQERSLEYARTSFVRSNMLKQVMNPRNSGPEDSFMETSTPGCAMSAPLLTIPSSTATTASRFISMKMSTRVLTTENSGFNATAVTSGITLIARSNATIIWTSNRLSLTIRRSPTSAPLAQSPLRQTRPSLSQQKWLLNLLLSKMKMFKCTITLKILLTKITHKIRK
jgi:hypothetical protein